MHGKYRAEAQRRNRANNKRYGAIVRLIALFLLCYSQANSQPYPYSTYIKGISFDWTSLDRRAAGSDNWPMTWADDDHQYTSWGDGNGFSGSRVSLGIARISGPFNNYSGKDLWVGNGKAYGIICVDGNLYFGAGPNSNSASRTEWRIYQSTDHGIGFTGAEWAHKYSFAGIRGSFINHGRNNLDALDEYVYCPMLIWEDQIVSVLRPGNIYLARVRKNEIFTGTSAYSWYIGMTGGHPQWGSVDQRKPIFTDNSGIGWCCNIVYDPWIHRYLLTVEHQSSSAGKLGIFESEDPWGPWNTVFYGDFTFGSTVPATCFFWSFAPKWFRDNGREFTLVFSGTGVNDSWNTVNGSFRVDEIKTSAGISGKEEGNTEVTGNNHLGQNYPNPFHSATVIPFGTSVPGLVKITIYNIRGQVVRILTDTVYEGGLHEVTWNGTDEYGNRLASGIYICRMVLQGSFTEARMMILLE